MPEITEVPDPAEELARQIIRISFVLRSEHHQPGVSNLSTGQREIMRLIVRYPGITTADIATLTGKFTSNISSGVKELTRRGFIARDPNPADRRVIRLHPTLKAITEMGALYRHWAQQLDDAITKLPTAEKARILKAIPALTALTALLETPTKQPSPPPVVITAPTAADISENMSNISAPTS